jgi:hypothetical protein
MMFTPEDPQFDALRQERQAQYGVAIAYIKRQVGPGWEYANEVARAVLSPNGGYFELAEMPEEFAGAVGAGVSHRLAHASEALETMRRLERLAVAVVRGEVVLRSISLYVLYAGGSLKTRQSLFVLDHQQGAPPFAHGDLQANVVPRFAKLRLDAGPDDGVLADFGLTSGVHFLLAPSQTDTNRCLLGAFLRTPGQANLSTRPASTAIN